MWLLSCKMKTQLTRTMIVPNYFKNSQLINSRIITRNMKNKFKRVYMITCTDGI